MFYNTMSPAEIAVIRNLSLAAKKAKRGIWADLMLHVSQLNPLLPTLIYSGPLWILTRTCAVDAASRR